MYSRWKWLEEDSAKRVMEQEEQQRHVQHIGRTKPERRAVVAYDAANCGNLLPTFRDLSGPIFRKLQRKCV